jgi:hypothetical protein
MLVVYSDHPQQLSRLRAALPDEQPVVLTEEFRQVEYTAPTSHCAVVLIEWLRSSPAFPRLSAFKTRHPQLPVVLVTRWDPENARQLKDVRVEEVVWYREIEQELPTAVHRVCVHEINGLRCMARPFEEAEHLPAALRTALAHACRSEVPVASVNELAAAVGSNRRTLWYQWRKAVGPSSRLRLQDFVHWTLLLRALGRKTPDRTWAAVAEDVGVHAHTLWRFARQLAGRTLPELAGEGQPELARRFREGVIAFILGEKESLDIL